MIKISFWLKKSDIEQGSLEYITIDNPQKVLEGKYTGMYSCETYLSVEREKAFPVYASNPIDAIFYASNVARIYLQNYVLKRGYKISEKESGETWKEAWKLESGESQLILRERIKKIKEMQDISLENKQKILRIMKESFGKIPHMKSSFD